MTRTALRTRDGPLPEVGTLDTGLALDTFIKVMEHVHQAPDPFTAQMLELFELVFKSRHSMTVFSTLLEVRVSTAKEIHVSTKIGLQSLYKILQRFIESSIVVKALELPSKKKGGRPTTIFAIKGYEEEILIQKVHEIQRKRTPLLREADRCVQVLLNQFMIPSSRQSIDRREIVVFLRNHYATNNFPVNDLADAVARELSSHSIAGVPIRVRW